MTEEVTKYADRDQVAITLDQKELIKKTIAVGATDEELKLFFYDCSRRGVHPLDKLIHFTKRKGKYVPITSIDFMRTRAAESGEYAGNDDPVFKGNSGSNEFSASVTVHRLIQGHICLYTATARWSEYKPEEDFMWIKMPYTMLGKCAEALALRKAFPQQLAGLYEGSEMDQAGKEHERPPLQEPKKKQNGEKPATKVITSIKDLSIKQGERQGKDGKIPWTLYKITADDGIFYQTFDTKIGDMAKGENGTGVKFEIEFQLKEFVKDGKKNVSYEIVSMMPIEREPGQE